MLSKQEQLLTKNLTNIYLTYMKSKTNENQRQLWFNLKKLFFFN